jgi:hypothetical protein
MTESAPTVDRFEGAPPPTRHAVLAMAIDSSSSRAHLAFLPGGNEVQAEVRRSTVMLGETTTTRAVRQRVRELGWRGQAGDLACLMISSEEVLVRVEEYPTTDPNEARTMAEGAFGALLGSDAAKYVSSIQVLHRGSNRTVCALAVFKRERLERSFAALRKLGIENACFALDSTVAWQSASAPVRDGYWGRIFRSGDGNRSTACLLQIQEGVIRSFRQRCYDRSFADASEAEAVAAELFPEEMREDNSLPVRWEITADPAGAPEHLVEAVRLAAGGDLLAFEMQPDFWREQLRHDRNRRRSFAITGALAAIYVLFLLHLGGASFMNWQEDKQLQQELRGQASSFKEAMELKRQLAAVRASLDPSSSALEVLRQIGENLPEGMTIENFSFRFQESVKLRGVSTQSELVYDFVGKLRRVPTFRNAKVDSVGANPSGGGVTWQMIIPLQGRGSEKGGAT